MRKAAVSNGPQIDEKSVDNVMPGRTLLVVPSLLANAASYGSP
jgi:hypothetical protein